MLTILRLCWCNPIIVLVFSFPLQSFSADEIAGKWTRASAGFRVKACLSSASFSGLALNRCKRNWDVTSLCPFTWLLLSVEPGKFQTKPILLARIWFRVARCLWLWYRCLSSLFGWFYPLQIDFSADQQEGEFTFIFTKVGSCSCSKTMLQNIM